MLISLITLVCEILGLLAGAEVGRIGEVVARVDDKVVNVDGAAAADDEEEADDAAAAEEEREVVVVEVEATQEVELPVEIGAAPVMETVVCLIETAPL